MLEGSQLIVPFPKTVIALAFLEKCQTMNCELCSVDRFNMPQQSPYLKHQEIILCRIAKNSKDVPSSIFRVTWQRLNHKWWSNTILWAEIVFLSKKIQFLITVLYLHRWSAKFLQLQKFSHMKIHQLV